jgi:hypothetical protein
VVETPLHPGARGRGGFIIPPKMFMDEIRASFVDLNDSVAFARRSMLDISLTLNVPQSLIITGV